MSSEMEQVKCLPEEEILFENAFTPTEKIFREYVNFQFYDKVVVGYVIGLITALIAVWPLYDIVLFWPGGLFEWGDFAYRLIVPVFCFFLVRFGRRRILKHIIKQEQSLGAGTVRDRRYKFYDDRIESATSPDLIFPYENLSKIVTADLCIYVVMKMKEPAILLIKKDSFLKGDCEALIAFLKPKLGPKRQHLVKTFSKRRNRIIWMISICGTAVLFLSFVLMDLLV